MEKNIKESNKEIEELNKENDELSIELEKKDKLQKVLDDIKEKYGKDLKIKN